MDTVHTQKADHKDLNYKEQYHKSQDDRVEDHLDENYLEQKQRNELTGVFIQKREEAPLLTKLRKQYEITGAISLVFGIFFALSFYQAGLGANALFFTAVMVQLLMTAMRKYEIPLKRGTKLYYGLALLFGLSTALTENEALQLMNIISILILLNISILHQLHEDGSWDFMQYLSKIFGMLFLGIASIGMPFVDSVSFLKRSKLFKNDRLRNIFIGVIVAIPLLLVIIALLSGADMLFGDMTRNVYDFLFSADIIGVAFMLIFGFLSCYCILCGAAAQTGRSEARTRKKADASIAITVMLLICLVYAVFCGMQVMYLFANGLFTLPEGYTFAEYARQGFFELLAVAIINVALMLIITAFFTEKRLLRGLLTFMTACTYILIGSATYRMLLYIGTYHLTFLRLFVLLSLFIIALILGGVIVSVYHKSFPLFRYSTVVIAVCYLLFSMARPDYFIASYLIDHQSRFDLEDASFLTYELSLDAAPVVLPILEDNSYWSESIGYLKENYHNKITHEKDSRDFRDFNLSSDIAARYLQKYLK